MRLLFQTVLVVMLLIGSASPSLALDTSKELPFGVQGLGGAYSSGHLNTLGLLGLNYVAEMNNDLIGVNIDALYDRNMQVARGGKPYRGSPGDPTPEAPFEYSYSNYAAIDVGYPYANKEVRMVSIDSGGYYSQGCWLSPENSIDTLCGISTWDSMFYRAYGGDDPLKNRVTLENKYFYGYPGPDTIRYYLRFKASINNPDMSADTVAHIRLNFGADGDNYWWPPCTLFTEKSFGLLANQFDTISTIHNVEVATFTIPDTVVMSYCNGPHVTYHRTNSQERWAPYLMLEIATTGAKQLAIDSIYIYDQYGRELIEPTIVNNDTIYVHDDQIAAKISQYTSRSNKIIAWEMMDEPLYANFLPIKHIKKIIHDQDSTCGWGIYCYNWKYNPKETQIRSWLKTVDEDHAFPDIYTFFDADQNYCGPFYQDTATWPGGALYMFNRNLSWVREEVDDEGKEFWIGLQASEDCPSAPHPLRMPTASELSCETYMALAWGAQGLNYYYYYATDTNWCDGILTTGGDTTALYHELRTDIGPYIQAVDEYYMPLVWHASYVYHHSNPVYSPPQGSLVSLIDAVSNPDGSKSEGDPPDNPDLGWFQVGEYKDSTGDTSYVMVVNRACSKDDAGNPAPSITAVIYFDPSTVDSPNLFIVDLANSVKFDSTANQWIVVPDTVYSDTLNGKIPFTTTFEPGEGRLFKLIKTGKLTLSGQINTNYTYQGKISVTGDAVVNTNKTMRIQRPARIEICRLDDQFSGVDTSLVELKVSGKLVVTGTLLSPIVFCPDTTGTCDSLQIGSPQSGDWYGIAIDSTGSSDTSTSCFLSYCSITYAKYGVESKYHRHTIVQHSNISNCEIAGIYCRKGYLNVSYSSINDNEIYGIYGQSADIDVDHSRLLTNISYGIKLSGYATSTDSTLIIYDTLSLGASSPNNAAIYISGIDKARVYKCKARGGYQTGLYLYDSNALVTNNDFSSNLYYGIYADNYSLPKIRSCRLDTLTIGVKTSNSKPDLGKYNGGGGSDYGNCSFYIPGSGSGIYYIYHYYNPAKPDTFYAQENFYNGTPFAGKFYWSSSNSPIKYSPWLAQAPLAPRLNPGEQIPLAFELRQNYPNPFNPITTIAFTLDGPAPTSITIYNILGQRVTTLLDEYRQAGNQAVIWDGTDQSGGQVSSGIYFYVIESGEHLEAKKMTLLR